MKATVPREHFMSLSRVLVDVLVDRGWSVPGSYAVLIIIGIFFTEMFVFALFGSDYVLFCVVATSWRKHLTFIYTAPSQECPV